LHYDLLQKLRELMKSPNYLKTGDAFISYDPDVHQVRISGYMRMTEISDYDPFLRFLVECTEKSKRPLILDVVNLDYLNSSGITTLIMFVLTMKGTSALPVLIKGNKNTFWQTRSLHNLTKFYPAASIEYV